MWYTTGRCLAIWAKVTLVLGACLLVAGFVWGFGTPAFTTALIAAAVVELLTVRGLIREWVFDARGCWWWLG